MRTWLFPTLCLALFSACSGGAPAAPPAPPAPPPQAALPSALAPAAAPAGALTGKVAEKIDAGTYSYLRLQTAGGEMWAAVPVTPVTVGTEVAIQNPMTMNGFESKTLGRVFDKIVFGTLAGAGAPAAAPGAAAHAVPTGGAADPALMPAPRLPAPAEEIKVAKAEGPGAHTVAEIFAGKAGLAEKKVTLRGKVVKFSAGILGRNWAHVRDGSGTAATADHDLTVTTAQTAAVGDVVLVQGTVHLDQDFGAGYAYPVLVGEATFTK